MSKKRTAQNLKQDRKVQEANYEKAKRNGDEVGMKRAERAIKEIDQKVMDLI